MAKVAFLGPEGSFTHQATAKAFGSAYGYILSVQATFEEIFVAVQSGNAQHGVVPIENSSNGPVTQTLNLLGDRKGRFADLQVTGEIYLPVEHYLLGNPPQDAQESSRDGASDAQSIGIRHGGEPLFDLSHVTLVESHPQALGQCKGFLGSYCKDVKRRDTSSTSQAAENAKADSTGKTAAIASKLCAEITGLTILAAAIQDDSRNTTRFLILQRRDHASDTMSTDSANQNGETGNYKTLVVFTVSHEEPGALAKALAVFSKHDINLSGMHTAPLGEGMWQYSFFVEFQGRREAHAEEKVDKALNELESAVRWVRWLGSWEDKGER